MGGILGVGLSVGLTEHVEVVPATGICLGWVIHGLVEDIHDRAVVARGLAVKTHQLGTRTVRVRTVPSVRQVTAGTPGVGHGGSEVPRTVDAPVAQRVQDRSTGIVQSLTHGVVAVEGELGSSFFTIVEAVVIFQVVNLERISMPEETETVLEGSTYTPASPESCIFLLMPERASIAGTGHRASTGVYTQLQAHGVNLVCDVLDSVGKFLRIRNEIARGVPACGPAVIHDDVFVAQIFEAE